jgi:hypothetical protein
MIVSSIVKNVKIKIRIKFTIFHFFIFLLITNKVARIKPKKNDQIKSGYFWISMENILTKDTKLSKTPDINDIRKFPLILFQQYLIPFFFKF